MIQHADDISSIHLINKKFDIQTIKPIRIINDNGNGHYKVTFNNQILDLYLRLKDPRKKVYAYRINGRWQDAKVETTLSKLIDQLGFNASNSSQESAVSAPMPGLVLDIDVSVGDHILSGQKLLTLEAMKMENIIKSPREGIISSIQISVGEKVDKNKVLIEYK